MSLQEPQDQIEPETVDSTEEQSQDVPVESALSDSDEFTSSTESESVDVPTDELEPLTDDTNASVEEEDPDEVDEPAPPAKNQAPSSGELPHPEVPEGPAWYVIHCYSGYENKVRHNLEQRIETMGLKE